MSERLQQLKSHLLPPAAASSLKEKNDDDVVIVAAYRTAITRAGKGLFKDTNSDVILYKLLSKFIKKTKLDPNVLGDVIVGNVLNPGAGVNEHRAAAIAAGIPSTVPFMAINRQCSSGLMAVADVANKIAKGEIDAGLGCGVESMSSNYGPQAAPKISEIVLNAKKDAQDCLLPMGMTSENVNEMFSIGRKEQDEFAAKSYQKAEMAVSAGLFKNEILPIEVEVEIDDENDDDDDDDNKQNPAAPKTKTIIVDTDEGPRKGVTAEKLSKIKPAFKPTGGSHAGNASQVSDGAAVVLLMRRSFALQNGYPIVAKYIGCSVVGVPPGIMGIGPALAIPALLKKHDVEVREIDQFEINEAFAGQALFSVKKVGIDEAKVNPRGGAIALGHPLGATGARQVATWIGESKPGNVGVVSMCIGGGQGAAGLFVRE